MADRKYFMNGSLLDGDGAVGVDLDDIQKATKGESKLLIMLGADVS